MTDRTDDPQDWFEDEARFAAEEQAEWDAAETRSRAELDRTEGRGAEIKDIRPVDHRSPLCVVCENAPGTVERADGEWECLDCFTLRADRDFERMREREQGVDQQDHTQGETNG